MVMRLWWRTLYFAKDSFYIHIIFYLMPWCLIISAIFAVITHIRSNSAFILFCVAFILVNAISTNFIFFFCMTCLFRTCVIMALVPVVVSSIFSPFATLILVIPTIYIISLICCSPIYSSPRAIKLHFGYLISKLSLVNMHPRNISCLFLILKMSVFSFHLRQCSVHGVLRILL